MKYQIYYRPEGLPKNETPLTPRQIEHHASCLPAELRQDPLLRETAMRVRCSLKGERSSVEIVPEGPGDRAAFHEDLGNAVRRINWQVPGLCFVIDSFPGAAASEA